MINTGLNLCSVYFPLEKHFLDKIESQTQIKMECFEYSTKEKSLHRQIYAILLDNLFNFQILGSDIKDQEVYKKINQMLWDNFKDDWKNYTSIRTSSELHSINVQGYLKIVESEESVQNYWDLESVLHLGSRITGE